MTTSSHILLVDEEESGQALQAALQSDGYQVEMLTDGGAAHRAVRTQDLDLLIADLLVPGTDGFELLSAARTVRPSMPVILMSGYGTVETAVQALRRGAFHYFQKPLDLEAVRSTVSEALETNVPHPSLPTRPAPRPARLAGGEVGIVGRGAWLEEALDVLRRVAPTRTTVLLTGASGTGKELFARAVHRLSGRKGPFVAVSCAALSRDLLESELFGHEKGSFTGADHRRPGRFELAHTGTLFLDEIGEVPLDLQVKLLRVLQERQFERVGGTDTLTVDVRIVAATNRDLTAAIEERQFREDLYYRLKVIEILLPPLRERPQDVEPLAEHFVQYYASVSGKPALALGPEALHVLHQYPWPGNVRELENTIERAVVLAEPWENSLTPALLPASMRGLLPPVTPAVESPATPPAAQAEEDWTARLAQVLAATDGNAVKAAQVLGVSPRLVRYHADRAGLWRRRNGKGDTPGLPLGSGTDVAKAEVVER